MIRKQSEQYPQSSWSLDQLKNWLRLACRRLATEAWWVGKALSYARPQMKAEGMWMEFCREALPGISYETACRYIRLSEAVKDPDVLQDVDLNKAYQLACIVHVKAKVTKPEQSHMTPDQPTKSASGLATEGDPLDAEDLDDADDPARAPDVQQRQLRPGAILDFFAGKVVEQLTALQQMPKQARWKDLDVERLRTNLEALRTLIDGALKDLPKRQRKAG